MEKLVLPIGVTLYTAHALTTMPPTIKGRKMLYPDLSDAKLISFDIETYDPYLKELGLGVFRKDGYICGVSIATDTGYSEYYSLHHYDTPSSEREKNRNYIESVLNTTTPKLGVNCRYDISWLDNGLGIKVNGKLNDIQVAEPLLDEYQGHYSLDFQARKYLGEGKKNDSLIKWCEERGLKGDPRIHLYKMPYSLVRDYGIGDAFQPLEIFAKQCPLMEAQNLIPLYEMEMELYHPILAMQKQGIRVDRTRIAKYIDVIGHDVALWEAQLFSEYGTFNVNSSAQIAKVLDRIGVKYGKTDKDNPQIDHEYLEFYCDHPIAKQLLKIRSAKKVLSTFLMGAFSEYNVQDRIHPNFITMKQDEGGAVTGRLSCQDPNLQQVPAKDDTESSVGTYGTECRSVFIAEDDCWFGKIDYSQIEYRIISHYSIGPKSDDIKKAFNDDPHTDYHALVQRWIKEITGTELERKKVKNLNFGTAYYMGITSMSRKFGWPYELSQELNEIYFDTFPFIKPTRNEVVNTAKARGYVRTILGRRARVTQEMRDKEREFIVWNHLVQGTAADILKKAMVESWKAGIFNVLKPHLTVHDELDVSIPKTIEGIEAYRELKNIMENVVHLKVPIIAEAEVGPSWGETEKCNFDELRRQVC